MVRAEIEYRKMGLDKVRPFSEVTTPKSTRTLTDAEKADPVLNQILKTSDRIFIEQFAALAQDYTLRNRNYSKEVYKAKPTNPYEVAISFEAADVSPANPQVMILRGKRKGKNIAHAVMVEGMREDAAHITYEIKDPNYPGDVRIIRYSKATRKYEGYPEYNTFQHDNTELPEANKRMFRELIKGASSEKNPRLPLWRGNSKSKKKIYVPPPIPSRALNNNMSATRNKIGGVSLYFDPSIVESEGGDFSRWKMIRDMTAALASGKDMVLAQNSQQLDLQAVSLKTALMHDEFMDHIGEAAINRIFGYMTVEGDDDFYILGTLDPGFAPMSFDVFTTALDEIWRQGHVPAISLDPDPIDAFGPQHVRLVNISDKNANTEFVKVMVEADYEMKHIFFSGEEHNVVGFKSTYELYQENPSGAKAGTQVRYWLYPRETIGADVFVIHEGKATIVFFESDVKVLTEKMMDAMNFSMTGPLSTVDEESARLFTAQYPAIAERWPVFKKLDALFDAAKLAAVLRAQGVSHKLLDVAASRSVAKVDIPKTYDGLGPVWVEGTPIFIGGGCESSRRLQKSKFVYKPMVTLALLTKNEFNGSNYNIVLEVPGVMEIDEGIAENINVELEIHEAMKDIMSGNNEPALERLNGLIENIGENDTFTLYGALAFRALANIGNGRMKEALQDINSIKLELSYIVSLRSIIKMYNHDPKGAFLDAHKAAIMGDDKLLLINKATVELMTMNWKNLEKTFVRLKKVAPADLDVAALKQSYKVMKKLGRKKARLRVKQYLETPFSIMLAMEQGQSLGVAGVLDKAVEQFELVLKLEKTGGPNVKNLFVKERAWMALIELYEGMRKAEVAFQLEKRPYYRNWNSSAGKEPEDKKNTLIKKFIEARPKWITPYAMRLGYGSDWDPKQNGGEQLKVYRKAVKLDRAADPLIDELEIVLGADALAYYGMELIPLTAPRFRKDGMDNLKDFSFLLKTMKSKFDTGPTLHYINSVSNYLYLIEGVVKIAAQYGMDVGEEPKDTSIIPLVEKEIKKKLGMTPKEIVRGDFMLEKIAQMPKPKDGSGLMEVQTIAKFWLPAYMAGLEKEMETFKEEFDSEEELEKIKLELEGENLSEEEKFAAMKPYFEKINTVTEKLTAKILGALDMIDVEWEGQQALTVAAAMNNSLLVVNATTQIGYLMQDPRWIRLQLDADLGDLTPDQYISRSKEILDYIITSDKRATKTMQAFSKALAGMMIGEVMKSLVEKKMEGQGGYYGEERYGDLETSMEDAKKWQKAYFRAVRTDFGIHTVLREMPLETPMDVIMAKQLVQVFDKILPQLSNSPEEAGRLLRTMMETKARLDIRLTKMTQD